MKKGRGMREGKWMCAVILCLQAACCVTGIWQNGDRLRPVKEECVQEQPAQTYTPVFRAAGKRNNKVVKSIPGLKKEKISVYIPEIKRKYKFIFMSDLHILVENDEISPEWADEVHTRRELFRTENGMYSAELWNEMPDLLNSWGADAVLLGGDMVDYASGANIKCLKNGIQKIKAPVMYVRADHDLYPYYCKKEVSKKAKRLHKSIDGNKGIFLKEFEDLCLVGINHSTNQISKRQLKKFKKILALGKPVILLTHVPLDSTVDDSLSEASRRMWQNRALVWGKECEYKPNKYTKEFLKLVYAKKSQVKVALGGHLHFTWDGMLSKKGRQHVFSPMYLGYVGIVTVN